MGGMLATSLTWFLLNTVGNLQSGCFICWDLHRIGAGKIPLFIFRKHAQFLIFFFFLISPYTKILVLPRFVSSMAQQKALNPITVL